MHSSEVQKLNPGLSSLPSTRHSTDSEDNMILVPLGIWLEETIFVVVGIHIKRDSLVPYVLCKGIHLQDTECNQRLTRKM